MNSENSEEVSQKSMQLFQLCCQHFTDEKDLSVFAGAVAALGIALLRGIEGHEFVNGFLKGAIEETNPLVISPQKLQ